MIKSVAVIGATHGNEMSGIQLVSNWINHGIPAEYDDLVISCHLANQAALDANVRFIEEDLNRQFTEARLNDENTEVLETKLAQQLNQLLGPKGNAKHDLVIDIHNTTSNMGATLIILEADDFNLQMARYVKHVMPEANILVEDEKPYLDHHYLCTTGSKGVMIEVGAQPQGLLRADVYLATEKMAHAILTFVQLYNDNALPALPQCEAFRFGENILYPMDEQGRRTAMIHGSLQDRDFETLGPEEPAFQAFTGETIGWQGDEVTYPHFINEAAYHKLNVAFATAKRFML